MVNSLMIPRRLAACLALAAAVFSAGCVERRYTLRTDPPGALAIVNGEEVGQTPSRGRFSTTAIGR